MDRSRLLARLPVLCAALLIAVPAFAQDQPKDQTKSAPAATAAKPVPPAPTPAPVPAEHRPPTPKNQADSLLGKEVFGADGAQMGLVTNVLIDREGRPIALVIDFGGFLGVGNRKVAIDWKLMQFHPGNKDKPVTLSLSKDQLKSAPEYKADKAATQIVHGPVTAAKPAQPAKPEPTAKPAPPESAKPAAKPDSNEPK
jgi:hypothetical protein